MLLRELPQNPFSTASVNLRHSGIFVLSPPTMTDIRRCRGAARPAVCRICGGSNKGKHKKAGPRFLHGPAWLGIFSLSGDRGLGGLGHKLAIRTVYAIPRDHFRSKGKVHRNPAAGLEFPLSVERPAGVPPQLTSLVYMRLDQVPDLHRQHRKRLPTPAFLR